MRTKSQWTGWRVHPTIRCIRVSNDGRVQRLRRPRGLAGRRGFTDEWVDAVPSKIHAGYYAVCIYLPGEGRRYKGREYKWRNIAVHRLILEAFIGPRPPGMHCCHENGNPADNRLANLRWDTVKSNAADTARHGRRPFGVKHGNAKLTDHKVAQILDLLHEGKLTLIAISVRFGVSHVAIIGIRDGKAWTHVPRPTGFPFPREK